MVADRESLTLKILNTWLDTILIQFHPLPLFLTYIYKETSHLINNHLVQELTEWLKVQHCYCQTSLLDTIPSYFQQPYILTTYFSMTNFNNSFQISPRLCTYTSRGYPWAMLPPLSTTYPGGNILKIKTETIRWLCQMNEMHREIHSFYGRRKIHKATPCSKPWFYLVWIN